VAELLDNVMYEPGMFPGVIYRMKEPRVVILIFHSGKMVITGAKTGRDAEEAVRKLMALLRDEDLLMGV
jgi:transcription initiation factor TFIID TATA-box-binding protein